MKRVSYLDAAKGLGIIFVVLAHTLGVLVLNDPKPMMYELWKFLCSCTIAFFFSVSGCTIALTNETNKEFKSLVMKKAKAILYPYCIFSFIYFVYRLFAVFVSHNKDYSIKDIWECAIDGITFRGSSVLWFFSALFLGSLFFNILIRKTNRIITFLINFSLCMLTIKLSKYFNMDFWNKDYIHYGLGNIFMMLFRCFPTAFCINLGYEYYHLFSKTDNLKHHRLIELFSSILLIIVTAILGQKLTMDFAKNYYDSVLIAIICMVCGSLGLILLSKSLLDYKFFQFLGKNAVIIMLTHIDFKVLPFALSISYALNKYVNHAKSYVLYASIITLVIVFEAIWIYLFSKKPLNKLISIK